MNVNHFSSKTKKERKELKLKRKRKDDAARRQGHIRHGLESAQVVVTKVS